MAEDLFNIDIGFNSSFNVSIHPVVGLQILDLYFRRLGKQQDQSKKVRIAGSLMGSVFTNKIHVTNCFALTVEEDQDDKNVYTLDFNEHRQLFQTYQLSYPNEVLLGAFVTGDIDLDIGVAYLSQEYARKDNFFFPTAVLNQPIILKIDASLLNGLFEFRAYRLNQSLKEYAGVASFNTLPVKIEFLDEKSSQIIPFLSRDDGLSVDNFRVVQNETPQDTIQEALKNIDILQQHVQAIIDGEKIGDENLGRKLLKYLNSIEILKSENFIKEYKKISSESQMLQFLSNLAICQTIISERLSKI